MNTWKKTVPDFLKLFHIVSDMPHHEKQYSATKDPLVEIGSITTKFTSSMTDEAFMERPNLKAHYYAGENKFPAMVPAGKLSDSVNWDGESHELENALP